MNGATTMDGVGQRLTEALQAECTYGDSRVYALARVRDLLDELAEFPEAHQAISRAYARSRAVNEQRKRVEKNMLMEKQDANH